MAWQTDETWEFHPRAEGFYPGSSVVFVPVAGNRLLSIGRVASPHTVFTRWPFLRVMLHEQRSIEGWGLWHDLGTPRYVFIGEPETLEENRPAGATWEPDHYLGLPVGNGSYVASIPVGSYLYRLVLLAPDLALVVFSTTDRATGSLDHEWITWAMCVRIVGDEVELGTPKRIFWRAGYDSGQPYGRNPMVSAATHNGVSRYFWPRPSSLVRLNSQRALWLYHTQLRVSGGDVSQYGSTQGHAIPIERNGLTITSGESNWPYHEGAPGGLFPPHTFDIHGDDVHDYRVQSVPVGAARLSEDRVVVQLTCRRAEDAWYPSTWHVLLDAEGNPVSQAKAWVGDRSDESSPPSEVKVNDDVTMIRPGLAASYWVMRRSGGGAEIHLHRLGLNDALPNESQPWGVSANANPPVLVGPYPATQDHAFGYIDDRFWLFDLQLNPLHDQAAPIARAVSRHLRSPWGMVFEGEDLLGLGLINSGNNALYLFTLVHPPLIEPPPIRQRIDGRLVSQLLAFSRA